MKKKKILVALLPSVVLPIFISSSCGSGIKNVPNQPGVSTETEAIKLKPAKKIDKPKPNTTPNQPSTPVGKISPAMTLTPAKKIDKPKPNTTPNQPSNPNVVSTPASRLTPAKPIFTVPNIDWKINNTATIENSKLPNYIDQNATSQEIKNKLAKLDLNGGFINSTVSLNTDFVKIKKDDSFQLKFGDTNLSLNDFDVFIKNGQNIETLDEFKQNANREFDIENNGLIKGLKNNTNWTDSVYDYLVWLKNKQTNNYYSAAIKVHGDQSADWEEKSIKTYANIRKIASYFSNIEDKIERMLAINNYIVDYITYDLDSMTKYKQLHAAAGYRRAVCEGFARFFQSLTINSGFDDVVYADGNIIKDTPELSKQNNTTAHAWNYALIDGKWYLIDTTWNQTEQPWHRNKYETNYFLARPSDMVKQREIRKNILDKGGAKDLRYLVYEKEGTFVNGDKLNFDPADTSDIHAILKNQLMKPYIKDGKYHFRLIFKDTLYFSMLSRLKNYIGFDHEWFNNGKAYYHTNNKYHCIILKLSKEEVASKFSDLNINNPTTINITDAKFINQKEIQVTFNNSVANLVKENFSLNFTDTFGITMNFANIDEIKTTDNKTYTIKLRDVLNLVTEKNAKIDLNITHPSYQFNFNNQSNKLALIQNHLNSPDIKYSIEGNKKVKFSGFTNNTYYSLNNGFNWYKMPADGILTLKIETDFWVAERSTNGSFSSEIRSLVNFRQYKQPRNLKVINKKQIVGVNNMMEYCIGYLHEINNNGEIIKTWRPNEQWHSVTNNHINVEHPDSVYFVRVKSNPALNILCSDAEQVAIK